MTRYSVAKMLKTTISRDIPFNLPVVKIGILSAFSVFDVLLSLVAVFFQDFRVYRVFRDHFFVKPPPCVFFWPLQFWIRFPTCWSNISEGTSKFSNLCNLKSKVSIALQQWCVKAVIRQNDFEERPQMLQIWGYNPSAHSTMVMSTSHKLLNII